MIIEILVLFLMSIFMGTVSSNDIYEKPATVALEEIISDDYSDEEDYSEEDDEFEEDYSEEDIDAEIDRLLEEGQKEDEIEKEFDKLPDKIKVLLVATDIYSDSTLEEQEITIKYKFIDEKTMIIKYITPDMEDEYEIYKIVGRYVVGDISGYDTLGEIDTYSSVLEPESKIDLYESYTENMEIYESNISSISEENSLGDIYEKMIKSEKLNKEDSGLSI